MNISKSNTLQIAIDGPAGSGKSTVAKLVADRLNILYLDTGAMYRSFALYAKENCVKGDDDNAITELFKTFNLSFDEGKIFLNNKEITKDIRTKDIDILVSDFAINPLVRKKLVEMQQKIGEKQDIIMEGRDIGTVVLKNAKYKFFFIADTEIRAKRRFLQNSESGISSDYEEILKDIIRRDNIDSSRKADPLKAADDSELIDTGKYTVEELVNYIVSRVKEENNKCCIN